MGFSNNQKKFTKLFIFRSNMLIDELFASISNKANWLQELEKKLEQSSFLANLATATITIGAVAAPATGGLSLAAAGGVVGVAGACIVITQFGKGAYKILVRSSANRLENADIDSSIDEHQLYLKIIMQELADMVALAYKHFLEDIIEESSIAAFAYLGAELSIEKLYKDILDQLKSYKSTQNLGQAINLQIDPDELFKHLLINSNKLQFLDNVKVKLKRDKASNNFLSNNFVPAKWAYARSRIAYHWVDAGVINAKFYKSKFEKTFLSANTTLSKFGYIGIDNLEIIEDKHLIEQDLDKNACKDIITRQSIYYQVTPEDVINYLSEVRTMDFSLRPSLNAYLSQKLGISVIAKCNDDRLKNLDLSGGNYTEFNAREAVFSGNLENTIWDNARLAKAKFIGANLASTTNFNNAYLELTEWSDLKFQGRFTQAKIKGAKFKNCFISLNHDIGCDWELVYFDENCKYPVANDEWREELEQRLTTELVARGIKHEKQRQEFLNWQNEQEDRWEQQERLNAENTQKIDYIENYLKEVTQQPLLEIFNTIHDNACREIEAATCDQFIDLNILPAGVAKIKQELGLFDRLLEFKDSASELFFLLHGVIGSGKTTSALRFFQELFLSCAQQEDFYPIMIKLKYIQSETSENFMEQCLLSQFDRAQIKLLKRNFRCLIILDGLEDCGIDFNKRYIVEECLNFNKECVKGPWKFLLTASTQLLLESVDYRERLRLAPTVNFPYESEYSIQPLTTDQIIDYVNKYYNDQVSFMTLNEFNLLGLAQNPIMLYIICEVLSSLPISADLPNSKTQFFQAFLDKWAKHVLQKTATERLTSKSILVYLKDLAYQMYLKNEPLIIRSLKNNLDPLEQERNSETEAFEYMFTNPLWKKAGMLAPIKVTRDDNREIMMYYIRTPFRMYALAYKLIEILKEVPISKVIAGWNHAYLVESSTIGVFEYLVELINLSGRRDFYVDILCQMVDASCGESGACFAKAASNAITLLNFMQYDFATNIDKMRWANAHINKADLSYAKLSGLYFGNLANLEDTKWQYAELIGTVIAGANLKGARFFDAISVIYTGKSLENFAVYPSDEPVIAYSVLKKLGVEDREIILVGAKSEKYPKISGHQTQIKAMDWGIRDSQPPVGFLASASVSGTIRVWEVIDNCTREVAKFKTPSGQAINSISCYKDGDLIATGDDDAKVNIWSLKASKSVFVYDLKAKVNSVIFGHDTKIILAVDDNGALSIWDLTSLQKNLREIQEPKIKIKNSKAPTSVPATSVALAVPEKYIAVGYANGDIVIFKLDIDNDSKIKDRLINVTIQKTLKRHTSAVNSIIWNAHCLVSGGDDGLVIVWDPKKGVCVNVYHGDGIPVKKVAWLMGGREIITAQDRKLLIYNPDLQMENNRSYSEIPVVINKSLVSDPKIFLGDAEGSIWAFNIDGIFLDGKQKLYSHPSSIIAISQSVDKRFLASVSSCNTVNIFDIQKNIISLACANIGQEIVGIHWLGRQTTKDPQLLIAYTDGSLITYKYNSKDLSWQWQNSKLLMDKVANNKSGEENFSADLPKQCIDKINTLAFAKGFDTEDYYFISENSGKFCIHFLNSLAKSQNLAISDLQDKSIVSLSFSPNNMYLLIKYNDESLTLVETITWRAVWHDYFPSYEKHILWVVDFENKQWLVIGTKDDLQIYSVDNVIKPVKRILKCVDNLAYSNGYLYVGEKKSIDVFEFAVIISTKEFAQAFSKRLGVGTSVLGLNIQDSHTLDEDNSLFAKYNGAIVSIKQDKSSMRTKILSSLGLYKENYASIPKPLLIAANHEKLVKSLYRENSYVFDQDSTSNSGAASPLQLIRDISKD